MGTIDTSSSTKSEMKEPLRQQSSLRANPPWLISGNISKTQEPVQQETNRRINPPWLNSDTGFKNYPKMDPSRKRRRASNKQVRPRLANLASSNVEASNILSQQDGSKYSLRRGKIANSITENVLTSGNIEGYNKDIDGGAHDDVRILGGRILPSYMTSGMPAAASSSHCTGSGDQMNTSGSGEDRHLGKDERLIYQAALQDLNQPKTEVTPPDGLLSVPLLRHQKIALAWMLRKETKSLHCLGGILADDQGLGKTVSMIALILMRKALQTKSIPENFMNQNAEALDIDADEIDGNVKLEGDDDDKKLESKCLSHQESKAVNSDDDYDQNGSSGLDKVKNSDAGASTCVFSRKRLEAGTLVVCPASLLWQWARELDDKVADESKLSVLVYHGGTRTKDPSELAQYDVVVTTYTIVTNEVPKDAFVDEDDTAEKNMENSTRSSSTFAANKKRKNASNVSKKSKKQSRRRHHDDSSSDYECGPLARVRWFRVILDEAQTIKNHRTRVARACFNLPAKIKWCLSGTPMQNTVDDLYSYFRFIKYDPYSSYKSFLDTIKVPTSRNSLHGYKKLQAVLRTIMLRRTKGTLLDGEPIIKLPTKSVHLSKIEFSTEERAFYRQLEVDSRAQFKVYAAAGTVKQNYGNILLMLMRLRQACEHPHLVKGYKSDPIGNVSKQTLKKLTKEACLDLLNCLESSSAICCLCSDPPEDPVVTLCGHVFCYECVSGYITADDNMCPAPDCKQQLDHDVVFSESTLRGFISNEMVNGSTCQEKCIDKSTVVSGECGSSKIKAVLEVLQSHSEPRIPNSEPDSINDIQHTAEYSDSSIGGKTKTIVFSQWTGMLDLVEISLNEKFIEYRRLDGRMSLSARDQAVKDFSNDPEVTVMLMSLKAGNLGLNMVAASHVVLLDLWWNPTTEDQAVDRAHRIGQTRPVTVTRITIKDTVEDRILALQEEKRKMVASAFGEDQAGSSAARLTEDDLKRLFMV